MMIAARGASVVDFGLQALPGPDLLDPCRPGRPDGGLRRDEQRLCRRLLDLPPSGTMAHSFIEAHESEEQAFRDYAELYGDRRHPARGHLRQHRRDQDRRPRGAGLPRPGNPAFEASGSTAATSSNSAASPATTSSKTGVEFLRIFASGDLDEFRIAELLDAGAEIDGFGVGTRFTVSQHAPAIGIVYKIARYGDRDLHKTSPEKATLPGRKTILRTGKPHLREGHHHPLRAQAGRSAQTLRIRRADADHPGKAQDESCPPCPIPSRRSREPAEYPVEFAGSPVHSM